MLEVVMCESPGLVSYAMSWPCRMQGLGLCSKYERFRIHFGVWDEMEQAPVSAERDAADQMDEECGSFTTW